MLDIMLASDLPLLANDDNISCSNPAIPLPCRFCWPCLALVSSKDSAYILLSISLKAVLNKVCVALSLVIDGITPEFSSWENTFCSTP